MIRDTCTKFGSGMQKVTPIKLCMRKLLPAKSNVADNHYLQLKKVRHISPDKKNKILHNNAQCQKYKNCQHDEHFKYILVIKQQINIIDEQLAVQFTTVCKGNRAIALKRQISLW